MTSELDQSLPPERDTHGNTAKQPRNTSIGMLDYFSTIERLCQEKNIHPDNLEQFFKVHWLRNAVGGSFKRAQEMFENYIKYIETVPEEARALAIPPGITTAMNDLLSLITWYYRMSYEEIQNDKVKELLTRIDQLQSDNEDHLTRHRANEAEIAQYKDTVRTLNAKLETTDHTLNETISNLEQTRLDNTALGHQRDTAQAEADRLQQSCDNLTSQLAERKQELADQQTYLKQLVTESRHQQDQINSLVRERDGLIQTTSDLDSKLKQATDMLATQKSEHTRELGIASENCSKSEQKANKLESEFGKVSAELDATKGKHQEVIILNDHLTIQLQEKAQQSAAQDEEMRKLKEELLQTKAMLVAEKSISATMKDTISMLSGGISPRQPKQTKSSKPVSKKTDKS